MISDQCRTNRKYKIAMDVLHVTFSLLTDAGCFDAQIIRKSICTQTRFCKKCILMNSVLDKTHSNSG